MINMRVSLLITTCFIVILFMGCKGEDRAFSGEEVELARNLCTALLDSDEVSFVRLHLTKGDTTPDGRGNLMKVQDGTPSDDVGQKR